MLPVRCDAKGSSPFGVFATAAEWADILPRTSLLTWFNLVIRHNVRQITFKSAIVIDCFLSVKE